MQPRRNPRPQNRVYSKPSEVRAATALGYFIVLLADPFAAVLASRNTRFPPSHLEHSRSTVPPSVSARSHPPQFLSIRNYNQRRTLLPPWSPNFSLYSRMTHSSAFHILGKQIRARARIGVYFSNVSPLAFFIYPSLGLMFPTPGYIGQSAFHPLSSRATRVTGVEPLINLQFVSKMRCPFRA